MEKVSVVEGVMTSGRPEEDRPCFTCSHLLGLDARGSHGRCGNPGQEHVIARPRMGCAFWRDAQRKPPISTREEWIAAYGLPIEGWDDDIKPPRFKPALTAFAIRSAYQAAPTAQAKALAWDIARLHDSLFRAHAAITAQIAHLRQYADMRGLQRLADAIAEEPAVAHRLREQERKRRGRGY